MHELSSTPIAHRGLHSEQIPENSLAAFKAAMEHGYAVEFDVHLAKDWTPVVFHDFDLFRMTGVHGDIEHATSGQLASLRLLDTSQRVPTLGSVLELVDGRIPLFVEIKSRRFSKGGQGRLEAVLASRLRDYHGPATVLSFDPYSLEFFRKLVPDVARCQLAADMPDLEPELRRALRELILLPHSRPHCIGSRLDMLNSPAVERQRRAGLPIIAWTARTPEEYNRARSMADAVIFEGFLPQA